MQTAYRQVEDLLAQMREAAKSHVVDRLSDQLQVLVRGYLTPTIDTEGENFGLTLTERAIFQLLLKRIGQTVQKQALMDVIYASRLDKDEPEMKILDVFMCKMRKKLSNNGYRIDTVHGCGFRMVNDNSIPAGITSKRPNHYGLSRSVHGCNC